MIPKILYLTRKLAAFIVLPVILFSCTEEITDNYNTGLNEEALVTVVIKTPGAGTPATKALSAIEEEKVTQVDVLLFHPHTAGEDAGKFCYHASSNNVQGEGRTKNFTVNLPTGTFDIVILANAGDILSGLTLTNELKGDILNRMQKELPAVNSSGSKWWPTGNGFQPFPMWGEAGIKEIREGGVIDDPIVPLLRMVARVDVRTEAGNFKIKSVYVYNYNTVGKLVSGRAASNSQGSISATYPDIPSDPKTIKGPLEYPVSPEEETRFEKTIYLFEADNHKDGAVKAQKDLTCLIIGGEYNNSGVITYYRVDFSGDNKSESSATTNPNSDDYWDIVRNRWYNFNILSVSGPGYSDPGQAFEAGPADMVAEIISWDENLNEITWNGLNELSVNKSLFEFHATGAAQSLLVFTDYHEGWEIIDQPGWITVDKTKGEANSLTEVIIESKVKDYSQQTITEDLLVLQAGNLKKNIKVTQDNALDLEINIDPASLSFYGSGGTKSVRINTVPEGLPLEFSVLSTGGIEGLELPSTMFPGNYYEFKVGQHSVPGDVTLTASVAVTATDTDGNKRQEILQVIQYPYDLIFRFTPWQHPTYGEKYPAKGSDSGETLYFYTQTARAWEYKEADFAGFTPVSNISQQPSEETPREFYFNLEANDSWAERPVTITVTTADVNLPSYDFTFRQLYTLPYIQDVNPYEVDFGEDNNGISKTVTFKSNSQWAVTGSDINVTPTSGGNNGSSLVSDEYTVTFHNKVLSGTGIPAAGSTVSATATINTLAPTNPQADPVEINLKRKIPAYFEFKSTDPVENTVLTRTGATVKVNVETNDTWILTSPLINGTAATMVASQWGAKNQTINIQNNDTWQERSLTVTYNQNGKAAQTLNYRQTGYNTTSGTVLNTSLDGLQRVETVRVYGDFPVNSVQVRAVLQSNGQAVSNEANVSASSGGFGSGSVTLNANFTSAPRMIQFQYKDPTMSDWVSAGTPMQQPMGYEYTVSVASGATIEWEGGTVSLSRTIVNGSTPASISIKACTTDTPTASSIATGTLTTATGALNITSQHTSTTADRKIYIYYLNGNNEWTKAGEVIQKHKPVNVEIGNIAVAIKDVDAPNTNHRLDWATAMGISTVYNTTLWTGTTVNKGTGTGCSGYSETDYPAGSWRLPTQDEMVSIVQYHLRSEDIDLRNANYWSKDQRNAEYANEVDEWGGAIRRRKLPCGEHVV